MNTNPISTERYKDHFITLHYDQDPLNPRENDNFGRMVCWHSRHRLGDPHPFTSPQQFNECLTIVEHSRNDIRLDAITCPESFLEESQDTPTPPPPLEHLVNQIDPAGATKVITLPLYLYDHSGITMRTTPFACRWDSGQVGYVYVDRATILQEYGGIRLTPDLQQRAIRCLTAEVEAYNAYIEGNIVGYHISKNGTYLDSCWGFDDHEYALREARSAVDTLIASHQHTTQLAA